MVQYRFFFNIYIYIYTASFFNWTMWHSDLSTVDRVHYINISWSTLVESDLKVPFSLTTIPRCWRCWRGCPPFPGLLYLPVIRPVLCHVKQRGIKHHFLSLWYDSTWDEITDSRTIITHSNRWAINLSQSFVMDVS